MQAELKSGEVITSAVRGISMLLARTQTRADENVKWKCRNMLKNENHISNYTKLKSAVRQDLLQKMVHGPSSQQNN